MHGLFIGRATVDLIQAVDGFPGPDDKVTAHARALTGGGPALNAAVTFAHLAAAAAPGPGANAGPGAHEGAGARATLVSRVGRGNPLSDLLRADLERHGVELIDLAEAPGYQPPVSTVISDTTAGTRCCVNTAEEAAAGLAGVELPDLAAVDVILLDQFQADLLRRHRQAFAEAPCEKVLDGGGWKPWSEEVLELATLPVVSERFLESSGRDRGEAPAAFFAERGFARWAVTRGARGLDYCDGGPVETLPAPRVAAVDTLAAGDVFHGALCFELARGTAFADALAAASRVAAESCRDLGPRAWMSAG